MSEGRDKLQAVKGMNDILPPESAKWSFVEKRARKAFENYGYREIRTPIVEYTPLFVRSIGEATDVVEKEMYTFTDRDERSITLRPEGTASVVRALLEHALHARDPVTRLYYSGPMFRHERAQRGRYRQFYQMGVETFGIAEPTIDAEQIAMLVGLFSDLGITGLETAINSVGGPDDRPRYKVALAAFLAPHRAALCPDCQRRLETNPLRILDCKVASCQALVAGAPLLIDFLGDAARAHFTGVQRALDTLGVAYTVDPKLVRGLDYYTGTTYEVRARGGDLGSQNTLAGGGRYDKLIAEMGGPPLPGIGFAFGMERVVMTLPGDPETFELPSEVFFVALGDAARLFCLKQAQSLRARGFRVDLEHRSVGMKAQMKRADRVGARVVVIVGDAELAANQVVLRDMKASEQRSIPADDLVSEIKRLVR